ncbi:MAG: hypothetical protein NZ602_14940, partial [Thermoguttaceae bacterium]|nr:hypothetical protein [Thermoguttaceae bacterium]MDW8038488.1 hypothetical protein [Thermoguttaceae bacterium]
GGLVNMNLSSTFAIFGPLVKEQSCNSLELLELGNPVNKRSVHRNFWSQTKLGKMAKVERRG